MVSMSKETRACLIRREANKEAGERQGKGSLVFTSLPKEPHLTQGQLLEYEGDPGMQTQGCVSGTDAMS